MQLTGKHLASRGTWCPRLAFIIVAVLLASRSGPAQARSNPVWNNNTGDGLWSTGGNWSTGSAPGTSDVAIFSGSTTACSVTSNVSVSGITISVPVTITVSSGVTVTMSGTFTQSIGTFNGGDSRMFVGGSLSLSGGTFKSTSGRLEIGAGFSKTGGTFTHNNGQVMLNATSGSQTFTSGSATFYDLTINDSLAGYWTFDDASGTSATDASGYANAGTLQNSPTWATSSLPGVAFNDTSAVTLNGTNQYVDVAVPATTSNAAFTACAWVKFSALTAAHTLISETGTNSSAFILKRDSGGKFAFLMTSSDVTSPTNYQTTGTTTVATGTWYHVCGVYSGSTGTLYVNGSTEGSAVTVSSSWAATGHTFIGASRWAGARTDYAPGTIDDVRIYKRALTATEISRLAAGNQPQTSVATQTLGGSPVVQHDLTIAAGSLAAGANALTVAGQWRNFGGLYTGTAAVTFNGTGTSNSIRSNGQSFSALNVTGTGTWTLTDALLMPTHAVTVSAGTLTGLSYAIDAGSVTKSGGSFIPGTGAVTFDGASDATIPDGTYGSLSIATAPGLIGYWKLDEGTGTSFADSSGNGNTGTLVNGPTWSSSVSSTIQFTDPEALSVAGGSDHGEVNVTSLGFNPTNGITLAYWIYYTAIPSASRDGVTLSNGTSAVVQTGLLHSSATGCGTTDCLAVWTAGGGGTPRAYTASPPASGWHHFAYTWDGTNSRLYIDGVAPTGTLITTNPPNNSTVSKVYLSTDDGTNEGFAGRLDDVRLYSRALGDTEIQKLASGLSTALPTYTLLGNATVTGAVSVTGGGISVGASVLTGSSGISVGASGTLTLASSGGTVAVGSGKSLTIDGTLNASSTGATIKAVSGTYTFKVGSSSTATPTLNVTGLNVQNTDASGLQINANTSASTTVTNLNNIAFSSGTADGTLLHIYAPTLNLVSNGCSFDASTTYTVTLVGDGFTTESTETRAVFGGSTCSAGSCQSTKSDDDSNNDGVPTTGSGGAVVQFLTNAPTDTAGTLQGFPTAAFSWNDGSYYSTYLAFNNTSSSAATVYVRDSTGAAKYSWSPSGSATIVGTPRWTTEGSSGSEKHYLYVALTSGKVYRLLDNGSSLAPDTTSTGWSSTNPYDCGCAITTPIAMDTTNLYWAGQKTSDSSYRIWAVGQADQSTPGWSPMRPSSVSSPATTETAVTAASLATWSNSGSTYVFLGQTGYLVKANVSTGTVAEYNSNPGTGKSILGRIIVVGTGTNRVLAGDDGGNFWSIDPATFSGTNQQWNYNGLAGTDQIKSTPIYDYAGGYVHFGTEGGRLVVVNASTGAALTGYPMTTLTTDPMRTAILYRAGVVAVGTTTGKLFFVNRRTTSTGTPQLMREYYFGSAEQVSGISYDSGSNRYLVTTSSSSANDGRLFTIDATESVLTDTDGIL